MQAAFRLRRQRASARASSRGTRCIGPRPRLFLYPALPPWNTVANGRLQMVIDSLLESKFHTAVGACADFFVVQNYEGLGREHKRSSRAVGETFDALAHRWPYWNASRRGGRRTHLLLLPCDHGPGDCMYDRKSWPLHSRALDPSNPHRRVSYLVLNGAAGGFNQFLRGVDIRLPSHSTHECGPLCGLDHASRREPIRYRAAQRLLQLSPWAACRSPAELDAMLHAARPLRLLWAGRSRAGFRREMWTHLANTSGYCLLDTSGLMPPSCVSRNGEPHPLLPESAMDPQGTPTLPWLMSRSDFCLSPLGQAGGDSDRYLPALLFGCIPVFGSRSETKPFEEVISWADIALNVHSTDGLSKLHSQLARVQATEIVRRRRAMRKAVTRMLWRSTGPFRLGSDGLSPRWAPPNETSAPGLVQQLHGERRPCTQVDGPAPDAFDTLMQVLRARLKPSKQQGSNDAHATEQ